VPLFAFSKPYTINMEGTGNNSMVGVINIYTDGSKTKMGSGCGIYSKSLKLNLSQAFGSMPSVLQTELIGITIAAEQIASKNITDKNVHIYTDCRQAVLTLSRPRFTSELVQ